ncbi:zona pellucida sperm-binding protein 4-like [Discoglossus pictus]
MGWLWLLVLLGVCAPFSTAEDLSEVEVEVILEEPRLLCGEDRLQYWIPDMLHDGQTLRVLIQDKYGKLQTFQNDSTCGILIGKSDGFLILDSIYEGCYTMTQQMDHVMILVLEQYAKGKWEVYSTEELSCPMVEGLIMDSPSPNVCSAVQRENRLSCASPSTSQDLCQQMGCCYDPADRNTPCYYGNKVTAQCTTDGQLSVAVSKDVTLPPLLLSSVRFPGGLGSGCNPLTQNAAFVLYVFPLTDCGTTRKVDGGSVIYENDMVADRDIRNWQGASITRDSTYRLHIRCGFTATGSVPLIVEVFTLPPPSPASSSGPLTLEMRIARDSTYSQYYTDGDYPIVKVLREPVFVEVRILYRSDPALNLVLEQCWATTSTNPLLQPQWPILVDRCPFTGDNYKTQQVPIGSSASISLPSYYERFIISTFTFMDTSSQQALGGLVYLHCSASVCIPSPSDSCVAACGISKNRNGQWVDIANNSACGIWLNKTPAGSVTIYAAYNGCFIHEKSYDSVMTISIERAYSGLWMSGHTVQLVCPIIKAHDAPSDDHCSPIQKGNRISCASSSVSRNSCESLGCCFDPNDSFTPCYYGNKVTVQCSQDGQISIAVSKDLTLPQLIVDSIRLEVADSTCSPVQKNIDFVLFQFPFSSCGTTFRLSGNNVLYENNLVADTDVRTWRGVSITRDSTLRLHIQCSYVSSDIIPLHVGILTLPPPLPVARSGPLTLEMRIAKDSQYVNYYADREYPVVKVLQNPISIEVRILQRNDPNMFLVLHECWATPTTDPTNQLQWPILVNGCPYTGDNYQTEQLSDASYTGLNFPMHYIRFIVNTFVFIAIPEQMPLEGLVYFHCSASACFPTALNSCETLCPTKKKKRSVSNLTDSVPVSSNGPVILQKPPDVDPNKVHEGSHTGIFSLEKEWVRIALVGCVLAAIIMIISLWHHMKDKFYFIVVSHQKTGVCGCATAPPGGVKIPKNYCIPDLAHKANRQKGPSACAEHRC